MTTPISLYCGVDPTAPSLHVGSLLVFATLRRFRSAGHRPIVVVGGATGFIGDPSGRSSERSLLDHATLDANWTAIRAQVERLLPPRDDCAPTLIVDNRDWTVGIAVLDFLRDVGKHFRVGEMLARDSVRSRLASDQGLSFTEFSYSLLQSLDFQVLRDRHQCLLQVGGSDQWGNIVAGIELIRRTLKDDAFGLTWPLLTRPDGEKFGKTADGNIWLDSSATSVWAFWQFWIGLADDEVGVMLRLLSAMPIDDIEALLAEHRLNPAARRAQRMLADEMTAWVHGADALPSIHAAVELLFERKVSDLTIDVVRTLTDEIPTIRLSPESLRQMDCAALAMRLGLAAGRGEAARLIEAGGITVNGLRILDSSAPIGGLAKAGAILLRRGRRQFHLVLEDATKKDAAA